MIADMALGDAPDRKKLLLVGATTGYQTHVFAKAAERLGFKLVLGTDRCHVLEDPWGDHALALRFEDPEQSAEVLATEAGVTGMVALGDGPAYIAALAAERLRIPYNSPDSVLACHDKFMARERFRAAGLLVPEFSRGHRTGRRAGRRQRPISRGAKAVGAIGQPRSDTGEQSQGIRDRVSPHREAAGRSGDRAVEGAAKPLHPGRELY